MEIIIEDEPVVHTTVESTNYLIDTLTHVQKCLYDIVNKGFFYFLLLHNA